MAISTAIPCALASYCFYRAGTHYVRFKIKLVDEKEAAMIQAKAAQIELKSDAIINLQLKI